MADSRSHRRLQANRNRQRNSYPPHLRQYMSQMFDAERRRRRNSVSTNRDNSNRNIVTYGHRITVAIPQLRHTLNAPGPMTETEMVEILSQQSIGTQEKKALMSSMTMYLSLLGKFSQLTLPTQALLDSKENCTICLCVIDMSSYIRTLMCRHIFHSVCIDKWLQEYLTCPLCRRGILGNPFEVRETSERQDGPYDAEEAEEQLPVHSELESPLSPILEPQSDDSWRELEDDNSHTSSQTEVPGAYAIKSPTKEEEEVPAKRPRYSSQSDDAAGPSSSSWYEELAHSPLLASDEIEHRSSTPVHHTSSAETIDNGYNRSADAASESSSQHDDFIEVIENQLEFPEVSIEEDMADDHETPKVQQLDTVCNDANKLEEAVSESSSQQDCSSEVIENQVDSPEVSTEKDVADDCDLPKVQQSDAVDNDQDKLAEAVSESSSELNYSFEFVDVQFKFPEAPTEKDVADDRDLPEERQADADDNKKSEKTLISKKCYCENIRDILTGRVPYSAYTSPEFSENSSTNRLRAALDLLCRQPMVEEQDAEEKDDVAPVPVNNGDDDEIYVISSDSDE